MRMRT